MDKVDTLIKIYELKGIRLDSMSFRLGFRCAILECLHIIATEYKDIDEDIKQAILNTKLPI